VPRLREVTFDGADGTRLAYHQAGAGRPLVGVPGGPMQASALVLRNPSPRAVGLEVTDLDRRQVAERRRGESWFPDAFAALERIWSGKATAADWAAIAPFTYGRWDAIAQAHLALEASQTNGEAAAVYYSAGALDPEATSAALARSGRRSWSSPVSTTWRSLPGAPPSMPGCSVGPSWWCSRTAGTSPGSTIPDGSSRPW
jgi:hypothetical protein